MRRITVIYHHEPPHGWWAKSPDIAGWSAAAASLPELYGLVADGVPFALETHQVSIRHRLADDVDTSSLTSIDASELRGDRLAMPAFG